jgi:hypothetical protein
MYTQNHKYMYKNDRVTRRYSEPFKLKILAELSTGKYIKNQLGKHYKYPLKINTLYYLLIKYIIVNLQTLFEREMFN